MTGRALLLSSLLAVLSTIGCGADELVDEQQAPTTIGGKADGLSSPTVQLLFARTRYQGMRQAGNGAYTRWDAYGVVEVENLAYQKQVVVHHGECTSPNNCPWQDTAASYLGPGPGNRERWAFTTPVKEIWGLTGSSSPLLFAIRYGVSGQTFWDANGGADYRLEYGPTPVALGGSAVLLASASATTGGLTVKACVKDLAYTKSVSLVYTTDGWVTVKTAPLAYDAALPGAPSVESWKAQLALPAAATKLRFALRYEVAGAVYWDNNLGADYGLAVPGTLE